MTPELYVVELGVGNGGQARTWLDEFAALSGMHSRNYYRRLHYLMGDYSPHVLGRASKTVAHHGDRVNALVVDATRPSVSLGFLRGSAFLVYVSNVYDNLLSMGRGRSTDFGPFPADRCLRLVAAVVQHAEMRGAGQMLEHGAQPCGTGDHAWQVFELSADAVESREPF